MKNIQEEDLNVIKYVILLLKATLECEECDERLEPYIKEALERIDNLKSKIK